MSETAKGLNVFQKAAKFFREVRGEMRKVVWPTWTQTVNNTVIVIAVILIVAVFLAVVDFVLAVLVKGVITQDIVKAFMDALKFQ